MKPAHRICATCSSFDPAHGCWASVNHLEQAEAPHAWRDLPGPTDSCKDHHTSLESEARDAALYALWQPLLIKSRWARTKGRKGIQ
jgi:hypothetical protein